MTITPAGRAFAVATLAITLLGTTFGRAAAQDLDVPYVPTAQGAVEEMLRMAGAGPGDIHYDLGSGDGRIVITAVRDFNVGRSTGVDLDPQRIEESLHNARAAGVADKVRFVEGNVFDFDFSDATVLTMYLLPWVNEALRPKVLDLAPGTRVVSHAFDMADWRPDEHRRAHGSNLYLWVVPAKAGGSWRAEGYRLDLEQKYQDVSGTLATPEGTAEIAEATLDGAMLRFEAQVAGRTLRFEGRVLNGRVIDATIDGRRVELERTS